MDYNILFLWFFNINDVNILCSLIEKVKKRKNRLLSKFQKLTQSFLLQSHDRELVTNKSKIQIGKIQ